MMLKKCQKRSTKTQTYPTCSISFDVWIQMITQYEEKTTYKYFYYSVDKLAKIVFHSINRYDIQASWQLTGHSGDFIETVLQQY